jgi:hypothetical protein
MAVSRPRYAVAVALEDETTEADTPARRVRAALELTDLTERMFVQRLLRGGATEDEARARLLAWRSEPGTHADDPWFVVRTLEPPA